MYSAEDLLAKLKEIENLIREKTYPDDSCGYDIERVMVSLEIARRMLIELAEIYVDKATIIEP